MTSRSILQRLSYLSHRALVLLRTNPRLFGVRVMAHLRYYWLIARLGTNGLRLLDETHERDTRAEERYADWLSNAAVSQSAPVGDGPLLSVLLPVHNPPADVFEAALASVLAQTYPHWELCIADDASTQPHVRATIACAVFRPTAGHIASATNSADDRALIRHTPHLQSCSGGRSEGEEAMRTALLFPYFADVRITRTEVLPDELIVEARPRATIARCPDCYRRSRHVHSHYTRTLADQPIGERRVTIHLRVRRFRCRTAG